jgi:hypothetical protein
VIAINKNGNLSSVIEWDLFLDESGDFDDPKFSESNVPRIIQPQIAGFIAPRGAFTEEAADTVLSSVFAAVRQPRPQVVHGTELSRGKGAWKHLKSWPERKDAYRALVIALLAEMKARGLQPVRLINAEGVHYRDRIETQVTMTAVLAVQIARLLGTQRPEVNVSIYLARVSLRSGAISSDRYAAAVERELRLVLTRHETPGKRWRAAVASITPAAQSWRLQIADLISHATHENFSVCDTRTKQSLQEALDGYDIALALPVALEQAERSLARAATGVALQLLAERELGDGNARYADRVAHDLLQRCLDSLVDTSVETRDDHLAHLVAWVRLLVSDARSVDLARQVCDWIIGAIEKPLLARLAAPENIAWFGFALRAWLLTAHNHAGQITKGRALAKGLEESFKILAGRWEHTETLLGGMLTLAVHNIDCRNFEVAIAQADRVAEFYRDMTDLFWDAIPGAISTEVRSTLRGKALGTGLQARLHRGLANADAIAEARAMSDMAIAEFPPGDGRRRQHQYRAFLETQAGAYAAGRRHLGLALDPALAHSGAEPDHQTLADAIAACGAAQRGFLLLHWVRIGAMAQQSGDASESSAFGHALDKSGLREEPYCTGIDRFPSQGILSHMATFEIGRGQDDVGIRLLRKLIGLKSVAEAPALTVIVIGALARNAAVLWPRQRVKAWRLLTLPRHGLGAIVNNAKEAAQPFPAIQALLDEVDALLAAVTDGTDSTHIPKLLHAVASKIMV